MKKLALLILIFFLAGCNNSINSFEDCINAGNPVMESYPRQCSADGKTFTETIPDNQVIGGEKDKHGCLTSAGYSYDEDISACTRSWEITNVNQIKAAKLAVNNLGSKTGLTITEINNMGCLGCYEIVLTLNQETKRVLIENWEVVEKTKKNYCEEGSEEADFCIEVYEPVCGYDDLDNPVRTFSNSCYACRNEAVVYWIDESCSS